MESANPSSKSIEIAVIGSGIAGLSSGWLLSQNSGFHIDVFERANTLGLDANALDVDIRGKPKPWVVETDSPSSSKSNSNSTKNPSDFVRIDVPLRVFSENYYPNLSRLYDHSSVEFNSEDYCGSFTRRYGEKAYFVYRNILLGGKSLPFVTPSTRIFSLDFWVLLKDYVSFTLFSIWDLVHNKNSISDMTFGEYVEHRNFSPVFKNDFIFPCLSAILTCSYESVSKYPADVVLYYMAMRRSGGVRRASSGTLDVVQRLSKNFRKIYLGCGVESVTRPSPNGKIKIVDAKGGIHFYDRVVFATQANHALQILKDASTKEKSILGAFSYEASDLVLHVDPKLMPRQTADWASVNFILDPPNDKNKALLTNFGKPMVSIWMNAVLQGSPQKFPNIFQTWNPLVRPDPKSIIVSGSFERPLVTHTSRKALKKLLDLQGNSNIYFCGAHVGSGAPLLENAVTSGLQVAELIGTAKRPWGQLPPTKLQTWHAVLQGPIIFSFLILTLFAYLFFIYLKNFFNFG